MLATYNWNKPHKFIARDHVEAATLSLRAAITLLEIARQHTQGGERAAWVDSAIGLATDAISEAQASIEPRS